MPLNPNTQPKQIVDVNGHLTTRHVSTNKTTKGVDRVASIVPVKPSLDRSKYSSPLDRTIQNTPLKEMGPALLSAAIQHKFPSERVGDAIAMASYLHRKQTRGSRGSQPRDEYISHPLRNSLRAIRFNCESENIAIANIMHDTVEDCTDEMIAIEYPELDISDWTQQEKQDFAIDEIILPAFGERVAKTVKGVTNAPKKPGISKLQSQQEYREKVLKAIEDEDVFIVKTFDWLDNAGSLHHHVGEKPGMVKSMAGKYRPLAQAFIERLKTVEQIPEHSRALLEMKIREVEARLIEFEAMEL
jgi:(p)ppGpp synthase/HD superfamily hydrolase